LLASTLRSLHARPVLTPAMIQAAEAAGTPSGLDQQQDPVRLALLDLSLEDLSKLWSVFFQTRYVLSAACRAGTVLVEAALTPVASAAGAGDGVAGCAAAPAPAAPRGAAGRCRCAHHRRHARRHRG
jgi:hypothetical protein